MSEKFLEELWKHKASEEIGEAQEDRSVALYFDLKESLEKKPEFESLLTEVDARIKDYAQAVLRNSKERSTFESKESIQRTDQHRRIVHNALISTLNQLYRACKKEGVDNSWGNGIGLTIRDPQAMREKVADWALAVARDVLEEKGM
jgi:hypothetical protein